MSRISMLITVCCVALLLQAGAQQPAGTYNVQTDGTAAGNGVTDDTAAINAALAAAKVLGKDVYFPSGTYIVSGLISIPNATSLLGDQSGISLIKSTGGLQQIGEPTNNGLTVSNLSIEDLFFLNMQIFITGTQKDNIAIRRCVITADRAETASYTQLQLTRGDVGYIEDCIFMAAVVNGPSWNKKGLKGLQTYKNDDLIIRRNIFGIDLGNLYWMDTEWKGYPNWTNPEARLEQFRQEQGLAYRMGEMRGAIRLNECKGTIVQDNIFNFDPVACGVPQGTTGYMDVDHIIYATQAVNLKIISNWMRGQPQSPAGGLKHRDTDGPGVIAANYFVDTPLLLYSYENDLVHGLDNQLIYRNHFKILTPETVFVRNGISFYMTDTLAGVNNKIAGNIFECADGFSSISLGSGDPLEWLVYDSNQYISGTPIEIIGNLPPYSYTPGAPPAGETSPYDNYPIPDLNIPEYGKGYGNWILQFGLSGSNAAMHVDYDDDTVNNLYEFGCDGDPTNALDQGASSELVPNGLSLAYIHPQLSDAEENGLSYYLELTEELADAVWTNAYYTVSDTHVTGGTVDFVTNQIPTNVKDSQFVRLIIAD